MENILYTITIVNRIDIERREAMTIGTVYNAIERLKRGYADDLKIVISDERGAFKISSISLNHLMDENHTALMINLKRLNANGDNSDDK